METIASNVPNRFKLRKSTYLLRLALLAAAGSFSAQARAVCTISTVGSGPFAPGQNVVINASCSAPNLGPFSWSYSIITGAGGLPTTGPVACSDVVNPCISTYALGGGGVTATVYTVKLGYFASGSPTEATTSFSIQAASPPPAPTCAAISPVSAKINTATSQAFTISCDAGITATSWALTNSGGGSASLSCPANVRSCTVNGNGLAVDTYTLSHVGSAAGFVDDRKTAQISVEATPPPPPTPTCAPLSPASAGITTATSQSFSISCDAGITATSWSLKNSAGSAVTLSCPDNVRSCTVSGNTLAVGSYTLTHTGSAAGYPDDNKTSSLSVSATPPPPTCAPLSPASASITTTTSQSFAISCDAGITSTSWALTNSAGTVVSLSCPANVRSCAVTGSNLAIGQYTLRHTGSAAGYPNDNKTATVTVSATPPPPTCAPISPGSASITPSTFQAFTITCDGGVTSTSWSLSTSGGTPVGISCPVNVRSCTVGNSTLPIGQYTLTHTANSAGYPTDSKTAQVTVYPDQTPKPTPAATPAPTPSPTKAPPQATGPATGTTFSQTFYNATINGGHYFTTTNPEEAAYLAAGGDGGGWQITRRGYRAWQASEPGRPSNAVPLYRFYIGSYGGKQLNSHFYTVDEGEARGLRDLNPSNTDVGAWKFEDIDSYVVPALEVPKRLGAGSKVCPPNHHRVYRAYNGKSLVDPNHRFSASYIEHYKLTQLLGYVDEGTAFCTPYSASNIADLEAYHVLANTSVQSGQALRGTYIFANHGAGAAANAVVRINAPTQVAWALGCEAAEGAVCPSSNDIAAWRNGIAVPTLPPGGFLTVTLEGAAPAFAGTSSLPLQFSNRIDPGPSTSEVNTGNNQTNTSEVFVHAASQCTYALSTDAITFDANGGTGFTRMKAPADCAWTTQSNAPWITPSPSGVGSATLTLIVQPNPANPARVGTVTSAGQTLTITQAGTPNVVPPSACVVDLEPRGAQLAYNDIADLKVFVKTNGVCAWSARAVEPWISIVANATGSGAMGITYALDRNVGTEPRTGRIQVGDKFITIIQKPSSVAREGDSQNHSDGGGGDAGNDSGPDSGGSGEGPGKRPPPSPK